MLAPTSPAILSLLLMGSVLQDPPPLPHGLDEETQEAVENNEKQADNPDSSLPSLPQGLEEQTDQKPTGLPSLPSGLGSLASTVSGAQASNSGDSNWFTERFTGFIEARAGLRLRADDTQKDVSIGELRVQLQSEFSAGPALFNLTTDFLLDPVTEDYTLDLEEGRGWLDLREATMILRPTDFLDLKIGRQIATWGTGDLVFINDLFPKDYNSFFIGRDDEYLKAPSDAIRASFFSDLVNVEVIYTPRFDSDRYIDGARLSYFNPLLGELAGRDAEIDPLTPDAWLDDDELAIRVSRNIGTFEVAAYGYDGYWKSPQGITSEIRFTFPELAVYGASIRGPVAGGIGYAEYGYYDSRDDNQGTDPFLPNSQTRYLVGYEKEAMTNLTIGVQYYVEHTEKYGALLDALPAGSTEPDKTRHVITTRITKLAYNQNLTLSLFNFYSPNEEDGYARARASYKMTDDWLVDAGVNIFYGDDTAFFGQFENNSNIYAGLRRSF